MKSWCKVLLPLLALFAFIAILTNDPSEYQSRVEYLAFLITAPLFPVFIFWFLYSWCNIETSDNGLWVEFVGRYLFIPWGEITKIEYIGWPYFGAWLLRTSEKQLTFFHRFYSLVYARSFQPGIIIHPQINSEKELIATIEKGMMNQP